MRKKFLLFCMVPFLSVFAHAAADKVLCFAIVEKNGEEAYFTISQWPIITYGESTITIVTEEYTIESLPLLEIERHYFTEAIPTVGGLENINTMDDPSTEFTDGKVLINGLKEGTRVNVYTADGQMVGSAVAHVDGIVCVDINSLKCGQVYILRTPLTSFKIAK